jgi:hypothetical protein
MRNKFLAVEVRMKRIGHLIWGFLVVLLLSSMAGATQNVSSESIAGRWEADGMPSGPWTFDLKTEGNTITGWVFQHGGIPGPIEIYDGRINGNTVTFKAKNPVVSTVTKLITFTGKVNNNMIEFNREIELVVIGQERTFNQEMGVLGQSGPVRFTAKRTGPVPLPAVPIRTSSSPLDVTGQWETLRWNLDVWIVDLKSSGTTVTGTISGTAGRGREQIATQSPVPIFDGHIEGNTISFKAKSDGKTIQLIGKVQGNEIVFARTVQLEAGAVFGGDQLFGSFGSNGFIMKRGSKGTPENDMHKQTASAKTLWSSRNIRQYEYTVVWQCLCPLPSVPFSYRVTGGAATPTIDDSVRFSMRGLPPQAMQPLLERYGTIDQLLDLLLAFEERQPFSTKIEYDPKLGYPISAEVHPAGISTADDFRFTITAFRALD